MMIVVSSITVLKMHVYDSFIGTGIEKVEVDGKSEKVTVTGYPHRNKILKAVRRGGLRADFWSPQNELLLLNAYASSAAAAPFPFNNFTSFF